MNNLQSTSNTSQNSSSEPTSLDDEADSPFALLARQLPQQQFTTYAELTAYLENRRQQLTNDQSSQPLITFTSVPPAQATRLSAEQSRTSKFCCFTYNAATQVLVAKIMIGPAHEVAARFFDVMIMFELRTMNVINEFSPIGSTTMTIGNWTKQADSSFGPVGAAVRPTCVLEVGLSESTNHLALDARGWLETPTTPVRLVLTMNINRQTRDIIIRRWELGSRQQGVRTRSSTTTQAACTQMVRLTRSNNTTAVTGEFYINGMTTATTQLILPFTKMFGRAPQAPAERDLAIHQQDLIDFAERIWKHQNLL